MSHELETPGILVAPQTYQLSLGTEFHQGLIESQQSQKRKFLERYFTNVDGRVTAVTSNMPSRLAAMLTARLSRATTHRVTELFWQEFVQSEELGISRLMDTQDTSIDDLLQQEKAQKMARRIVDGFGDDSVREQASGYVMVQDSSVLASMETFRLGVQVTGIEASTRYIPFSERDQDGKYRYVDPPDHFDEVAKSLYTKQNVLAFDTYARIWPKVWKHVEKKNPNGEKVSDAAYRSAVLGAVCDLLRGLLPLSTKTNYALHADFRSLSDLIVALKASSLSECPQTAGLMTHELLKVNPEFIEMVNSNHGLTWINYLADSHNLLSEYAEQIGRIPVDHSPQVEVRVLNKDYLMDIVSAVLGMSHPEVNLASLETAADHEIRSHTYRQLFKDLGDARKNRRHKLPMPLSAAIMAVRLENISMGGVKDLNRHRNVLVKSELRVDGSQGFFIPQDLMEVGEKGEIYNACVEVQERAIDTYHRLRHKYPEDGRLVLTHGTKGNMYLVMDVVEGFWISELRSMASGNPEYRFFAQQLYQAMINQMPELADLGSFVDNNDYDLGRIKEAVRADLKGKQ
jgi:thymidylate synthase ThyX